MTEIEIQNTPIPISLKIAGEIRFGPVYYTLVIHGKSVIGRVFGNKFSWESQSGLLALEEWHTTSGKEGPITSLCLVNPVLLVSAQFNKIRGYIRNVRFESDMVVFTKELIGTGKEIEVESTISKIGNWKPMSFEQ